MASFPATGSVTDRAEPLPTRRQALLFFGKTWGLRVARCWREARGGRPPRLRQEPVPEDAPLLAKSTGRLYTSDGLQEFSLQAGKAHNLRLAASRLHGLVVPAGETFSFWAHVPRPTRRRGFAAGRELREGCVIPSVGGGLCQLSNALYDAALTAGFEIVERHAHSRRLPGSMAEAGRDATVFWNYVDLRFRPPAGCRIEAFLTRTELIVGLRGLVGGSGMAGDLQAPSDAARGPKADLAGGSQPTDQPNGTPRSPSTPEEKALAAHAPAAATVESCETCGQFTCFRHPGQTTAAGGSTAWLVDAWWPEFDRYLQENRSAGDTLFLPLDGARFRLRSYRWHTEGFGRVRQAPLDTFRRAWRSRRLAAQGAVRQRALLGFDAALARHYARAIPPGATHLVISQNLLPFLWQSGALGGRTFDVWMTRLPLSALQRTLDRAAALHPGSPTLADFRADPTLAETEDAALAEANRWITPHSALARLGGARARRLSWQMPAPFVHPEAAARQREDAIFFPASTLGRKGAYELRTAARELGLHIRLGGPVLEGAGFWDGVPTSAGGSHGWVGARAVVLPAWVEHQPRRLLTAVAAGVPVIATEACGLAGMAGVTTIPEGDADALTAALRPFASLMPAGASSF